jgi:hypothetical protein
MRTVVFRLNALGEQHTRSRCGRGSSSRCPSATKSPRIDLVSYVWICFRGDRVWHYAINEFDLKIADRRAQDDVVALVRSVGQVDGKDLPELY